MSARPIATRELPSVFYAPPDTVQTMLMTGGSSAQNLDWFSTAGTAAANAAAAGVHLARITCLTTAAATMGMFINLFTTSAAVAASGTSVSSVGTNHPVLGSATFLIPGGSTGWSAASYTSGVCMMEQWRK